MLIFLFLPHLFCSNFWRCYTSQILPTEDHSLIDVICCQDHERAYFDSADWALGKVLNCFLPLFWATLHCTTWSLMPNDLAHFFNLFTSKGHKNQKAHLKHFAPSCRYLMFYDDFVSNFSFWNLLAFWITDYCIWCTKFGTTKCQSQIYIVFPLVRGSTWWMSLLHLNHVYNNETSVSMAGSCLCKGVYPSWMGLVWQLES